MRRSEIYSFEKEDGGPLSGKWVIEASGILDGEVLESERNPRNPARGMKALGRIKGNMFEAEDVEQWRLYMLELVRRRDERIRVLEEERTAEPRDERSDAAYAFLIGSMKEARDLAAERIEEFHSAFHEARTGLDASPRNMLTA